ncbi:RTA1-domain-containing protein [Myriangium duriaei CBS 260.36]|uniref:RTA1-domain-containing protein n=1 Tax=Myriangium duriaei CBS 260.36 TaxID=1168546 RepID=A0A9P4J2U9_9PEZI|nr:RTA1-domain-containing protein [Myriangium duriaei CBS 260.36]
MIPSLNGTLVDFNACTPAICSLAWAQLQYVPTVSGGVAYAILFGLLLLAQIGLGWKHRTWGFLVGMICGLLLEVIGYVARIQLSNDVFSFNAFVASLVCLTIAPAFISAAIYSSLSRLAVVYGQEVARFGPRTYTLAFISCDIMSLVLQAAGGAITATAVAGSSEKQTGVNTMIAGLASQVASLSLFLLLALDLIWQANHAPRDSLDPHFVSLRNRALFFWFPPAIMLATVAIFVRCCFRVAELKGGFGGGLANNQAMFMVFEGPMIMIALIILTIFHPGTCFGGMRGWRQANWVWRGGAKRNSDALEVEKMHTKGSRA